MSSINTILYKYIICWECMIFECTKAGVETRVKVGLGEIHILLHISKSLNICFASVVVCSGYSQPPIYIIAWEGSHNTWYFWRGGGWWIFEKSMKTPLMYWGITIFSNFNVRVGEKCQFLSDSKNMNFDGKWVKNVWYSRALISSTKV